MRTIADKCLPSNPFGIRSDFNNWKDKENMKTIADKCLPRKPFGVATNFSCWSESGIKCISKGRRQHFVEEKYFTDKNNVLNKWKVCTSKGDGAAQIDKGNGKRVISKVFILAPQTICTETYLVVNAFDKKEEAEIFLSYMRTKFFRFMLSIRTLTQNLTKKCFTFVPDAEDYSKSCTDEELYKKYKLSQEEIAYIESKIKAI